MVERAMSKGEVLVLLRERQPVLAERFGVGAVGLVAGLRFRSTFAVSG